MNSYKNISLWENTRRLRVLGEFRNDVVSYFHNSRYTETVGTRTENAEAVQARERINHTVLQAKRIIEAAGIPQTATWTRPRRSMEYKQKIHLIFNLFEFDSYQIPPPNAVDLIERAIGFFTSLIVERHFPVRSIRSGGCGAGSCGLRGFRSFFWAQWVLTQAERKEARRGSSSRRSSH